MNYAEYEQLAIDISEGIATVTINRPDVLNAMDVEMMDEFGRVWVELDADPEVKVVILTGAGDKFSAGANFQAIKSGGSWREPFSRDTFADVIRRVTDQLAVRVPVIAAVNGDAVGGAATIALLCDAVIMADTARLGDPHVRAGVPAGDGGSAIWPLLCGPLKAKHFLMTGDLMSADEAERLGLVTEVVPAGKVLERAQALARRYRDDLSPLGVKWTKYAINKSIRQALLDGLDTALALELVAFMSEDRQEAVNAFIERRSPHFQGR